MSAAKTARWVLSQLGVSEEGEHVLPVGGTTDLRFVPTCAPSPLARRHRSTTGGARPLRQDAEVVQARSSAGGQASTTSR